MIEDENDVEKILNFIGGYFFEKERLEKYIRERKDGFCNSEVVDEKHLLKNPDKNTKIFAVFGNDLNLVGGMTIKFYLWEKLRKQYFFTIDYDYIQNKKFITVNHIEDIVKNKFTDFDVDDIRVSLELDSFSVKEESRGKGIGKKLYEIFIEEAQKIPENPTFAFTIVLGKYSKIKIGEMFMKYFFKENSTIQKLPLDEAIKILNLPNDIFRVNEDSYGTVLLSKKFNFKFLGYAKYLGETWGYIFKY